jgi:sulfate/thiosulfate-binding protein
MCKQNPFSCPQKVVRWLVTMVLALTLIAAGCQSSANRGKEPIPRELVLRTIVVYGFSVEEEAMTEKIFPAFQEYWREQTGEEVIFESVFANAEEITQAILDGAAADVAILSNEQHAVWLRINDCVETDWQIFPHKGVISRSPIVIVVRPGNPLGIKDWADLARPGVSLVHADPLTSAGAQWALLAEYGSVLLDERIDSKQAACEQLRAIWANVVTSPISSREALRQFVFGTGDVLITYEQDAMLAQDRGATFEIVPPRSTIISEHLVVIVDQNVKRSERDVVEAFVAFLWSDTAQEAFTRYYFRPVTVEALNRLATSDEAIEPALPYFYEIERPFTVQDLGGWGQAYSEIIHGIWEEQIVPILHQN